MLVVSRRSNESILIRPDEGIDGETTLAELFAAGPIEIRFLGGNGRRVKMGINAPRQLSIWRQDSPDKNE
ncbi:MAG: carbon storage regulator [Pseudomonadota bacterium]